jgi:hypothetical protein
MQLVASVVLDVGVSASSSCPPSFIDVLETFEVIEAIEVIDGLLELLSFIPRFSLWNRRSSILLLRRPSDIPGTLLRESDPELWMLWVRRIIFSCKLDR